VEKIQVMYKLEMVLKRENHELLLEKQFMQINQKNPKNKTPTLYSMDPWDLPFQRMKNI